MTDSQPAGRPAWQTPLLVMICGCLIAIIGFGPRASLGLFLTPMSSLAWLGTRSVRAGACDPDADLGRGAALRRRDRRSLWSGHGSLHSAPCFMRAVSPGWRMRHRPANYISPAGFLTGFGLAGASFTVVIGAFGKLLPPKWRSLSFGLGTAARIIRTISVRAGRGRSQQCLSLADDIDDLRRHRAC